MTAHTEASLAVPSNSAEGQDIQRSIEVAIQHQARREAASVRVAVENGCVFLSGRVRSWSAWRLVHNAAESAQGVLSVDDRVQIDPDTYCAH